MKRLAIWLYCCLSNSYITHRLIRAQTCSFEHSAGCLLLAHLSRRLTCDLKVYQWSGVCPSVQFFKHLLLQNRLANQSQILCGASFVRGNESLFAASWSHDQDGRQPIYSKKIFKNLLLQNRRATKLGM